MPFDPSTLCARTTAGEAELATASQGLTLGQRRVLTLLENPAAVDELAEKFHLEPEKLARDLTRLAELRLVRLQGPGVDTGVDLGIVRIGEMRLVVGWRRHDLGRGDHRAVECHAGQRPRDRPRSQPPDRRQHLVVRCRK